ncbi:hypothetical protein ABL78_8436 [Leptomonas seymouri]|uniref:Uncharacterized protein n=1 Tax=Leptomonas seymouri TaxID=5684 RepID=A0A0N1PAV2_LEPSE|nr:hypothetical protein ABL78_8436 [Leptomonas seymouri]|eukprot:KPI82554.1 hypothetical protein ABL78_8436 [Leptomonas seymouri]
MGLLGCGDVRMGAARLCSAESLPTTSDGPCGHSFATSLLLLCCRVRHSALPCPTAVLRRHCGTKIVALLTWRRLSTNEGGAAVLCPVQLCRRCCPFFNFVFTSTTSSIFQPNRSANLIQPPWRFSPPFTAFPAAWRSPDCGASQPFALVIRPLELLLSAPHPAVSQQACARGHPPCYEE